jgi:ornithine carbamoyltransferase
LKLKKDFLSIADYSKSEIENLLETAAKLKQDVKQGIKHTICQGKTMAMIFAKPSARTRISFETGMFQLGGAALYLSPNDIGIGSREPVKDIARVIARYNDIIMARLFDHAHILELAKYASVPVINGLTDYNHPCQIMGDILTVLEHRGHLDDIKIAYMGDGNNVANSWINLAAKLPMHLTIACPEGYDPDEETLINARNQKISQIEIERDPVRGVADADVVYGDVWASMGQESEAEKRKNVFPPYQINAQLMRYAKPDAKVLHCLPAHRGEEITDDVIEGRQSIVFDEAENRLHMQKAIIVKLLAE